MGVFIMYCLGTALMSYPEIDEQAIKIMIAREAYPFGFIFASKLFAILLLFSLEFIFNLINGYSLSKIGITGFDVSSEMIVIFLKMNLLKTLL